MIWEWLSDARRRWGCVRSLPAPALQLSPKLRHERLLYAGSITRRTAFLDLEDIFRRLLGVRPFWHAGRAIHLKALASTVCPSRFSLLNFCRMASARFLAFFASPPRPAFRRTCS